MLILTLLLGCAEPDVEPDPLPEGPDPLDFPVDEAGPYAVGLQIWDVTYEPTPGESRTLSVHAWYPTEDEDGDSLLYSGIYPALDTLGNAVPIDPIHDDGFPVFAYSHGHQGFAATSADLMRWMASHGWVAVAPDHTDNLLHSNVEPTPSGHWYHRPLDIQTAVDALDEHPDLGGAVDTSRYVLSGHSRGVSTVWSLVGATFDPSLHDSWCDGCTANQLAAFDEVPDERVVAGIGLAGTYRASFFGDTGFSSVSTPVLSMTGTEDPVGQQDQWDLIDGVPLTWVEIQGACHQTFALGACSTLDTEEGYWMVDTFALAYARVHLLGDENPEVTGIIDGTVELDPRAAVQVE